MKTLLFFIATILLFSCGGNSNNIVCKCAEAGVALDSYANRFLTELPTDANRDSIALLKTELDKICAEVKKLPTAELEKQRDACDELSME